MTLLCIPVVIHTATEIIHALFQLCIKFLSKASIVLEQIHMSKEGIKAELAVPHEESSYREEGPKVLQIRVSVNKLQVPTKDNDSGPTTCAVHMEGDEDLEIMC